MKFGKVADLTGIDFSLPPIHPDTERILVGQPDPNFQLYVGLPRWSSKEWLGDLYPKGTKAGEFLKHYATTFNGIELNTTHYRSPGPEQVQKWADLTPDGFHFSPKIPQLISHYRKLANVERDVQDFTEAIRSFGDKLGDSFLQVHDSFGPSYFSTLERFLQQWPADIPLQLEFRHPEWFEGQQLRPELQRLLEQYQIGGLITDVSGRRDVCHSTLTTRSVMIRFVGNGLHETDYTRFEVWMERIAQWREMGLQRCYFFVHEPGDPYALSMGRHTLAKFDEKLGLELSRQEPPSGAQMSLF